MAQLGVPDMKAPIAYALTYPERVSTGVKPLDLTEISTLSFFKPDLIRFPALKLAYRSLQDGESMSAIMNAANEVAVEAFLSGKIKFTDIVTLIEKTMNLHKSHRLNSLDEVLSADLWSREKTRELLGE
jgi:1-deoxy-D-xylulose-5-phosphate reductoisomerase